ncbi:hypothetical protein APUTEX25_001008 [Auxenochlorella protothecoides]|uniref:MHD domain-containing protein n=2 Tax=Auxenochlorella protothecoides TaxID=3075 RepID=A0A3M7KSQ1_AUXPR|nr:hypothetical protein APUTEX25_001008 [Auxenochlorella protothecoides]|eukprot:RMZ52889.1 hypothetical protein APUTEX25_001008 [Auxenochlorella protothecoides]
MADTLFGYSIPFPTYDLYVAITAVALYIPSIILTTPEAFGRRVQASRASGSDLPPAVGIDGVQYLHVKVGDLLWVATTRVNLSPSLVSELLLRITVICRDYFGQVTEECVRRNLPLVYELLDEVMDYGFPQNSSTERLKQFIAIQPQAARSLPPGVTGVAGGEAFDRPAEVIKSVLDTSRTGPVKDEIFVDIVERLTATFDATGRQKSSSITGAVQIKSYLSGNPPIQLGLNEDLIIRGREGGPASRASSDAVVLETCSLHQAVDPRRLDTDRVLELVPPNGHFAAMNYRSTRSFRPPFRVYPLMEDDAVAPDKLTLYVRLRAEFPPSKTATGVELRLPLPRSVQRVHVETDGARPATLGLPSKTHFAQGAEWVERDRVLVWNLKHLRGSQEHTLRARLTVDAGSVEAVKRDYGPITVQFVLPGKPSASGLDVRYMKILKQEKNYNPARWFRVVAVANSYQIRPHWL